MQFKGRQTKEELLNRDPCMSICHPVCKLKFVAELLLEEFESSEPFCQYSKDGMRGMAETIEDCADDIQYLADIGQHVYSEHFREIKRLKARIEELETKRSIQHETV